MLAEIFLALFLTWSSRYVIVTYLKRRNMPPGPLPYPFIGNIPQLMCDPIKPFTKLAEKYGDIFTITFPSTDAVVLSTYSLIREARLERKDDVAGRSPDSIYPLNLMMEGDIFTADYSPLFCFRKRVFLSALHIFGDGMDQVLERSRNAVENMMEQINSKRGRPFSPSKFLDSAIIVQLWDWLTSKKLSPDDPIVENVTELACIIAKQAFLANWYQLFPFLAHLPTQSSREIKRVEKIKNDFFSSEFQEHMKSYTPGIIRDLTDSFISSYEKEITKGTRKDIGSMEDIPALILDVAVAGSHTTSTSLTWFLLYMVLHPNIQKKVHEELDLFVGRDRLPSWHDAEKLPYLQAALCEVQRASGIISVVGSDVIRDTMIGGYRIPKGTYVALNLSKMHHDERMWPEQEKFKPERFLDSEGIFVGWSKLQGFLPFSIGRRECPGQSLAKIMMFTFASMLLHRYKISLPEGAEIPTTEPSAGALVFAPQEFEIVASFRE